MVSLFENPVLFKIFAIYLTFAILGSLNYLWLKSKFPPMKYYRQNEFQVKKACESEREGERAEGVALFF